MNYCEIDEPHIKKLVEWMFKEVESSSGDGDGLWYSKYYNVEHILKLVYEYNDNQKLKWNVRYDENDQTIHIMRDQESLTITNNENYYNNAPIWQQFLLKY
jgi:hypothetical protein